ncbi:MAG: redoxin domain-containing protein, partial [Chitinophagales bacterium]|nr:redoxin domain-containing protein [Chitinophagales bacterium]
MQNFIVARDSQWIKASLFIAGLYSVIWGMIAMFFPEFWLNFALKEFVPILRILGVFSFTLGIGFLIAYTNPLRHWPIILIGLISKVIIFSTVLFHFLYNDLSSQILKMSIVNDAIWIVPFGLIIYNVYIHEYLLDRELILFSEHDLKHLLLWHDTNKHNSLFKMSQTQPVMLVFLRHFGCTFCRSMIQKLKENRSFIESKGIKIVLIHQINAIDAQAFLKRYEMDDLDLIGDPELILYKGFNLEKGKFFKIFGLKGLKEMFLKGKILKYGIGMFKDEDPF